MRLFAAKMVSDSHDFNRSDATYDLALIFLLLRLRRRTRFFLHLALILIDEAVGSC
jgi:hypothetical protein